ncbi:MAG: T9SS type A sorting domain-containing protein, partial [Chitinophagales bacterium]|nr:T9SS type A sorting domain-containing protein [Chitinophagales bacterium]
TLHSSDNCIVTKRIGDDTVYMNRKSNCATGAPIAEPSIKVVVYPNPGSGVFMCKQNNEPVLAEDVKIYTAQGTQLASFYNMHMFNIGHLPAGMYVYSITINRIKYTGKLVKV